MKGTVVFGPVCPVERIPPDPRCSPRPGVADIQLVTPDGTAVAEGRAGADGQFTVAARPGRYTVKASAPAPGPGRGCQAEPAQVTVAAGSFASVAVTCDTGIR
ncbi:MAG TPA: carboxypeptidase-like regulatory domain-containing protein [Acidimicrobiales bacterium]|nr:carboxypeptidase-like regulatory domain-containing protein [Acidimicrobiales bacterium]